MYEIYESEKEFINSITENNPNHAVKRIQLEEWYKPFGSKILASSNFPNVSEKLNNFSDGRYWTYTEYGDVLLNRAAIVKEILNLKTPDGKESMLSDYKQYKVSCWLCLEDNIRKIFPLLSKYKGKSESEKDFVTDTLSKYSELMAFWSHYIHVIDESGEYITDPNPEILSSFEALIAKYDNNLNYKNQVDLWKYGFECAKREGCIEGMEFFLTKLKEIKVEESELDKILVDTALYASSHTYFSLNHSKANAISFCLNRLGSEKYKMLLGDFKTRGYYILYRLRVGYLFGYAKELVNCLGPKNISHDEYSTYFIYGIGTQVGAAHNKELRKIGSSFLNWIWEEKNFIEHKNHCLGEIATPGRNAGLIDMLLSLAQAGAFGPLEKILDSVTEAGRKEIAKCHSYRTYCALHIQNRKDLLCKITGNVEYSNNFTKAINYIIEQNPKYKKKWHYVCKLHEQDKVKESMTKLLELLDDGLRDLIEKRLNELKKPGRGGDVPSSLSELESTISVAKNTSR